MKDLKISKELLSEVLKLEVVKHSLFNKLNSSFNITYMQSEDSLKSSWMPINIYEFAFKCKEWAFDHFYLSIIIFKVKDNVYKCEIANISDYLGEWITKHSFRADSEIEAIIKACEWILKHKVNQCTK